MAPDQYHHLIHKLTNFDAMLPSAGVSFSVGAVIATGLLAIIVQAATPIGDISWASDLTMKGALIVAVGVLWRALSAERSLNTKSTEAVTAALVSSTAANVELRAIIEHLRESLNEARR